MRRAAILLPLLAFLPTVSLAQAEPVFPPGSRIGLVPPPGLKPARGIAGFNDPATGAAIIVLEMPAEAYPSLSAGFDDAALKTQGFTPASRDTVRIGGADALLVTGEQNDNGRAVPKSVLLASDPSLTALVIAQSPVGASPVSREQMRDALKTVAIRPPLTMEEQVAALPFRLGEAAGFRPVRAVAGNSLLLTDGPKDVVRGAEQPMMIVALSFGPSPPPEQRDAFARSALASNTLLKETIFERSQGFRQAGSDWHEIVAKSKDGPSDQPVVVLQTIRFYPAGYLRMVGIARTEDREAVMPRFRRVVDNVALR